MLRVIYVFVFGVFMAAGPNFAADQDSPNKPKPMLTRFQCRQDMMDVTQAVKKALDEVHNAQKDGDKAKLRDALAEAEKALQKVQDHMENCPPAMRGPRGPHGMSMRHMMMDDAASTPEPDAKKSK